MPWMEGTKTKGLVDIECLLCARCYTKLSICIKSSNPYRQSGSYHLQTKGWRFRSLLKRLRVYPSDTALA